MALFIRALVACFVALWLAPAFALIPVSSSWDTSTCSSSSFPVPYWLSPAVAPNAAPSWTCQAATGSTRLCGYSYRADNGSTGFAGQCDQRKNAGSCPANSIPAGNDNCACSSGYVEANGQCKPQKNGPCGSLEDKPLGVPLNLSYGNRSVASLARMVGRTTKSCFGGGDGSQGCAVTGTVQGCWGASDGGAAGCRVTGAAFTGDSCEPDPNPDECPPGTEPSAYVPGVCIPKENNCPPGSSPSKYAAGVCIPDENTCPPGQSPSKYAQGVCVPDESPDADGNDEEGEPSKCPPGYVPSKYVKDICIPADRTSKPDGDVTCKDGVCTITKPDGTTEEKPQDTFCKENPDSPMCIKGQFGGSCGAGFSCEGDAIQCAMAKEQHRRNCELYGEDKDPASLTNKALNGNDPSSADALRANAQQVNVGMLDDGGFGWSRACPPDPSFDVPGGSFSIPFSKVCTPLEVLSLAAVGLTLLSSLLFVIGKKD